VAVLLEWDRRGALALAPAAYRLVEGRLGPALAAWASGQELIGRGYASDVAIAAELDASRSVPRLVDGLLT
jgi:2-phosphosulfolactate phosphatase